MTAGYISAIVLAVSGIAGVVVPRQVGAALDIGLPTGRAKAEFRVVYAAFGSLGLWAVITTEPTLFAAVGVSWLGAAAARMFALALDRPRADASYWAIFAMELTFGLAGVLGNG